MISIIKKIIFILVIFFIYFSFILFQGNNIKEKKIFNIESGQGVNEISNNLFKDGLINNKFILETYLWLIESEEKVKAGKYIFEPNISMFNLVKLILDTPRESQMSVTLLEGWDRILIGKELESNGFSSTIFLDLTKEKLNYVSQFSFLKDLPNKESLEGYIFPDTYYINIKTDENDFILKTLNNFDKKLDLSLREEIKKQNKSIFEIITLASIIEREVPNNEDKKMIADIFLKRLSIGMALQSDATINFITGKGMIQPTYDDLEVDSLYNTYKYPGLPPGPISNPGLDSIKAVIYPESNNYYFFLTSKDGKVIYSTTYDEHLQNKYKYLN